MARPWRIEFPGATYHVMGRGNNRADIFRDDHDRRSFLDLLKQSVLRYELELFSFCLMSNHYHLFLSTPRPNLSVAMHWLNAGHACRFKRRHRYSGHVLQGRFKSVLVTDEAHWLHLSMYIHLNPVRAGLVQDPAQHEWSSFQDYTRGGSRYRWLNTGVVLSAYGRKEAEQRRRYRAECITLSGNPPDFWEQFRSDLALGSQQALEKLAGKYAPAGDRKTVPEFTRAARQRVDPAAELEKLAGTMGLKAEDFMRRQRNFPPRFAAFHHLVENCGMSVSETAAYFGVSAAAVSNGIRKAQGVRS